MNFNFKPEWVYKTVNGKVKALVVREEADFKIMIQGGYTDSPGAAKDKTPHPALESYFEPKGQQKSDPKTIKTDLTIEEVEVLSYPDLKAYAIKLEGIFNVELDLPDQPSKEQLIKAVKDLRGISDEKELSLAEIEALKWPKLVEYAKKLEITSQTTIMRHNINKDEIMEKIKELRNANSTSTD